MEWYDYGVYSYAVTPIGRAFFPAHSATAELLSTFGVLAVSFAVRPFGGFFFGPLGDRSAGNGYWPPRSSRWRAPPS